MPSAKPPPPARAVWPRRRGRRGAGPVFRRGAGVFCGVCWGTGGGRESGPTGGAGLLGSRPGTYCRGRGCNPAHVITWRTWLAGAALSGLLGAAVRPTPGESRACRACAPVMSVMGGRAIAWINAWDWEIACLVRYLNTHRPRTHAPRYARTVSPSSVRNRVRQTHGATPYQPEGVGRRRCLAFRLSLSVAPISFRHTGVSFLLRHVVVTQKPNKGPAI